MRFKKKPVEITVYTNTYNFEVGDTSLYNDKTPLFYSRAPQQAYSIETLEQILVQMKELIKK